MKILFIRKGHVLAVCGCLIVLAIFCAVTAPATVAASVATRQLPIYCVDRDDNVVSISFDAAWGDVILRQNGLQLNCIKNAFPVEKSGTHFLE